MRLFELNRKLLLEYERIELETIDEENFDKRLYLDKVKRCELIERIVEQVAFSGEKLIGKSYESVFLQLSRLDRNGGWDKYHSERAVELLGRIQNEYQKIKDSSVF